MPESLNATETYGFIGWVASFLFLGVYLLWSLVPDSLLHELGITYCPSKYWAVALPVYFWVFVLMVQVCYQGLNLLLTKPFSSLYTLEDEYTRRGLAEGVGIPEITDIPIGVVNAVLYGSRPGQNHAS